MSVVTRGMKKRGFVIDIDSEDTRWQELPPEMLERILEYVSNKTDLLTCRLVNSNWESSGTSVIQKQSHRILTAWKWNTLNATPSPEGFLNLFPHVIIQPSEDKGQEQELLALQPKSGIDLVSTEANPIITKSLSLIGQICNTSNPAGFFKASKIFETHGSTLTSLYLGNMEVDPKEVIKILCHLDNLVALKLGFYDKLTLHDDKDINPNYKSFLPKLTHLSCHTNTRVFTLLLKHVASQLVSLKCACNMLLSYEEPFVFDKLKELRVYFPSKDFLGNGFRAPILERLHLESLLSSTTYEELMGFISQFASTLLELELSDGFDIKSLVQDLKCGSYKRAGASGVSFPKMSSFIYSLIFHHGFDNPVTWHYLKTMFLSRFPNLKAANLAFRTFDRMELLRKEEALSLCQQNDICNFCSELKVVQITHLRYRWDEQVCCFRFTREEME